MKEGGKLAGGNPERGRVENDFYATHPDSVKALLEKESVVFPALEPACGEGHISKEVENWAYPAKITSSDLIDRGYGISGKDFLLEYEKNQFATVITNPPFNLFTEFVRRGLEVASKKVIMFGKLQALEGQARANYLEKTPLKTVYVFKKRQQPLRDGKETDENGKKLSSTMAFAWFVWEKGYEGRPEIKWL